jgi:hypothetical protein
MMYPAISSFVSKIRKPSGNARAYLRKVAFEYAVFGNACASISRIAWISPLLNPRILTVLLSGILSVVMDVVAIRSSFEIKKPPRYINIKRAEQVDRRCLFPKQAAPHFTWWPTT